MNQINFCSPRSFSTKCLHGPQIVWPQNSSFMGDDDNDFYWNVLVINIFWNVNQAKKNSASLEAVEADQWQKTLHANWWQKKRGWNLLRGHMFEVQKFYFMLKEAFMNIQKFVLTWIFCTSILKPPKSLLLQYQ